VVLGSASAHGSWRCNVRRLLKAGSVRELALWLAVWMCLALTPCLTAQQYRPRATLKGHTREVDCVAVSPDGKILASGGADQSIPLGDLASGKEQAVLKAGDMGVASVAFSPDGKTLASGSFVSEVTLWDVRTRKATIRFGNGTQGRTLVVFSPSGKTLASGGR